MNARNLLKILQNRSKNLPVYIEISWSINGVEGKGYLPLTSIRAGKHGHFIDNGTIKDSALTVQNIVDYLKYFPDLPMCMTSIDIGSKATISYPEIDLKASISSIRKIRGKHYYIRNPQGKNKVLLLTSSCDFI